jgi:hypothetical protein
MTHGAHSRRPRVCCLSGRSDLFKHPGYRPLLGLLESAAHCSYDSDETRGAAARPGRYRGVICGLLKGSLQQQFSLDEVGYANIVFWFQAAYAFGYVTFGRLLDWIGDRRG